MKALLGNSQESNQQVKLHTKHHTQCAIIHDSIDSHIKEHAKNCQEADA